MQHAYKPREVIMLAQVVDQACADLGCCDEVTREIIAVRVIAYADRGERDFEKLLAHATCRPTK
jgi:hypothetical protein